MNKFVVWCCLLLAPALCWGQAHVIMRVDDKIGMSMTPFTAGGGAAAAFRKTLADDLARSGYFRMVSGSAEFTLSGTAEDTGGGVEARCHVVETAGSGARFSKSYSGDSATARRLAHKAADEIIEALTGKPGFNSARMVLVGNRSGSKELYLCDSDGLGMQQLTSDKSVSIGPYWSPDGSKITYTSFKQRYPDVYMIDLPSGNRKKIASYPGLNSGGAISPDGRYVALILSKDGNPDLYIKNLASDQLTRLTQTKNGAEASPSWSPDGSRIVYVSDRAGSPQLYIISRNGGEPRRLSSRGSQNVAPEWGANGIITFASLIGRFQVCTINPDTGEFRQISPGDGGDYEDPSWAPDGRHIVCARARQYRSGIYLLDTKGDSPVALLETSGDWYSPAWSPK